MSAAAASRRRFSVKNERRLAPADLRRIHDRRRRAGVSANREIAAIAAAFESEPELRLIEPPQLLAGRPRIVRAGRREMVQVGAPTRPDPAVKEWAAASDPFPGLSLPVAPPQPSPTARPATQPSAAISSVVINVSFKLEQKVVL